MRLGHPRRGQGPHSPLRQASGPQHLGVGYIDDPEFLTPADYISHIDMWNFMVPPCCGATNLGVLMRRTNEGAG